MKIGTATSVIHGMPALRRSLVEAWGSEPAVRRTPRQFHGKRPVRAPADPRDDLLILEIRRLREQENISLAEIHIIVAQFGFTRTPSWVYRTTQYHNRAHLVPADGAEPYLKAVA